MYVQTVWYCCIAFISTRLRDTSFNPPFPSIGFPKASNTRPSVFQHVLSLSGVVMPTASTHAADMGFQGSLPTYGGQYLGAPPQSPHPQPQPWQQQGWQNPRAPPHMTPYPQAAARGMQQSYQQYQQQQHMMQQMPQQLNANAQEWKPTWA